MKLLILLNGDVNDAFDVWKQPFNDVCDTHAPINERLARGLLNGL